LYWAPGAAPMAARRSPTWAQQRHHLSARYYDQRATDNGSRRVEREFCRLGSVISVGPGGRNASPVCASRPRRRTRGIPGFAHSPASTAAPTVDGREWRELFETTGMSRSEVATACPTDGVTACSGTVGGRNLTGWTWATVGQVRDLLDDHAPGLATADPPVVSGIDGFWAGISFLGVMRWTTYSSSTYSYLESTSGWTASRDAASGLPIGGFAAYSHRLADSTATGQHRSARPPTQPARFAECSSGAPPALTIRPQLSRPRSRARWATTTGTARRSPSADRDRQRVADSLTRWLRPLTLSVDSGGTAYACTATSAGGQGSGSGTVKRDATPPTITCGAAPDVRARPVHRHGQCRGHRLALRPAVGLDQQAGLDNDRGRAHPCAHCHRPCWEHGQPDLRLLRGRAQVPGQDTHDPGNGGQQRHPGERRAPT